MRQVSGRTIRRLLITVTISRYRLWLLLPCGEQSRLRCRPSSSVLQVIHQALPTESTPRTQDSLQISWTKIANHREYDPTSRDGCVALGKVQFNAHS